VAPYLYQLLTQTIVVTEGYSAELDCYLLVGTETNQTIVWTWLVNGTTISPSSTITIVSNKTSTALKFSTTYTYHTNSYTCKATNEYGSFSRTTTFIVKSKNTLSN
jgi:hypothetical protein